MYNYFEVSLYLSVKIHFRMENSSIRRPNYMVRAISLVAEEQKQTRPFQGGWIARAKIADQVDELYRGHDRCR